MITILTTGDFSPDRVRTRFAPDSRPPIPEVEQLIEWAWESAIAKPGVKLFDGPMCRLESWSVVDGRLDLVLSETTYKIFHGTNLTHPELAERYGPAIPANPVGLSAIVCSADGHLLLGRRNASVAYYPNRIHPFAGCLEPRDAGDIFGAMRRELQEELNLTPAELSDLRCIGIVEDPALRQPELIFRVSSHLTKNEIEIRLDAAEHDAIWSMPAHDVRLPEQTFIDSEMTPVAVGALRLWSARQ